jgi:predicted RNA-binding protein with TRAM domain
MADELLAKFSEEVQYEEGQYIIEVPENEVEHGTVSPNEVYSVEIFPSGDSDDPEEDLAAPTEDFESDPASALVDEGETYDVTITDTADDGDGIARIDGLVVLVPHTEEGDEVTVLIRDVRETYAFGFPVE